MKVALAQIDTVVGDIEGNAERAIEMIRRAEEEGAAIATLPELAITGYPPEDLLLKPSFVQANLDAMRLVASATGEVLAVFGFVDTDGKALYNAAAMCERGELVAVYRKQLLPNYGVFDEDRYFEPGTEHVLLESPEGVIGVCVCEDSWSPTGPVISQGDAGAQIVVNINASPFHKGKLVEREAMLSERARRAKASIVYVNTVGGQDELVFDGGSVVMGADGNQVARLPQFEEAFACVDVPLGETRTDGGASARRVKISSTSSGATPEPVLATPLDDPEEVYEAIRLGLRDYAHKNGFSKVVLGLSGGIDSALTATIATDAMGPDAVLAVSMPSPFSSEHSVTDSEELAKNLGIELLNLPISEGYRTFLDSLETSFGPHDMGVAEENLQARIRGLLLMTISNRYGHLVIATGNKSELAVGYATLYGDMAGGFAVLKDLFKVEVYDLARYRNKRSPVIPDAIINKAPSAELRPDQKDEDSLPPYELLDQILEAYIEDDAGVSEMIERGFDPVTVKRVVAMVDRAEYKRRQAAPGPKVTTKAFGRDRRLPITNRWRAED